MSVDVITTPRAVDVIGNITANWTFWQCRGHLKTHSKPALSLSLRVRRHSLPGEGKTFNCYGSSVYTSQPTGWDCVAWPGVYTLCASALYTTTSATTSRERTSSAHGNVKQGRRSSIKTGNVIRGSKAVGFQLIYSVVYIYSTHHLVHKQDTHASRGASLVGYNQTRTSTSYSSLLIVTRVRHLAAVQGNSINTLFSVSVTITILCIETNALISTGFHLLHYLRAHTSHA